MRGWGLSEVFLWRQNPDQGGAGRERFGVAEIRDEHVVGIEEKPKNHKSN
jgi:hypothetical protein